METAGNETDNDKEFSCCASIPKADNTTASEVLSCGWMEQFVRYVTSDYDCAVCIHKQS